MPLLYSNENFPLPVVQKLREFGHDVLTVQESGKSDQALLDAEVLAFAKRENRTLLRLNRLHFIRLHRNNADHTGIIVCTFDADFAGQGERINRAINDNLPLAGKLVRVNRE
ncbi:MAG TPA: DUF5615 family PIN-like protein [Verrucomicrobiae bacterium]|jgi:predicted nuclease of predicted toxin-antitoxin system